ncbi:MAG: hypothetical protein K2X87_12125 [Gemmataceae bacterium]|nr:hypothetical protein [Gemmataceae bacterium]
MNNEPTDPPYLNELGYREWMADMEASLGSLLQRTGPEVAAHLDYTVGSLDALEGWLLATYPDYRPLLDKDYRVWDAAGRYFGEVFRRAAGGEWVPNLEDDEGYSFGWPAIDNYPAKRGRIPPHFYITAAIDRRRGNFLSSLVRKLSS